MIEYLPIELVCMIADNCSLKDQASLARTCRQLHHACNSLLYKNDATNHGSSAVFHAIAHCVDQRVSLKTLEAAYTGGANLQKCQAFCNVKQRPFCTHLIVYPSLYLAAIRGLDCIVSFLLDHGVAPDGPEGVDIPPLFGALSSGQETTALMLVRRGASVTSERIGMNALHASVYSGLRRIAVHLVQCNNMDINERSRCGATPVMLAIYSGNAAMVPVLIGLGANVYDPLLSAFSGYDFEFALKLLDAANITLTNGLQLHECLDLLMFVIRQKSAYGKRAHRLVIDKLSTLIAVSCSEQQNAVRSLPRAGAEWNRHTLPINAAMFLDGLLQRMLSIDYGDPDIASTLIRRGATPQAGTFIEVLNALNSPLFQQNKQRLLRQHPKLLQIFQLVHSHCLSLPPGDRDMMTEYFLHRSPDDALCLIGKLSARGIGLTARGVQKLEHELASV